MIFSLCLALVCIRINNVLSETPTSPCPETFNYETKKGDDDEPDQWNGVIALRTVEDLHGVWLHVFLDRPAVLLGNWFGEVSSADKIEFVIKNPDYRLEAGPPVLVHFFIKYDPSKPAPTVKKIRLNGRTICSTQKDELSRPTMPTLHVDEPAATSEKPSRKTNGRGSSNQQSYTPIIINSSHRQNHEPFTNDDSYSSTRPGSNSNRDRDPAYGDQSNNRNNRDPAYGDQSIYHSTTSKPYRTTKRPSSSHQIADSSENSDSDRDSISKPQRPNSNGHSLSYTTSDRDSSNYGSTENPRRTTTTSRPSVISYFGEREDEENDSQEGYDRGSSAHNQRPDEYDSASQGQSGQQRPNSGDFQTATQSQSNSKHGTVQKIQPGCGTVAMSASPLISHGQNTTQGEWPWHAAIYHSKGLQLVYTCGGTLVSDRHIITAAHCVTKPRTNNPVNRKFILVYLGKYNLLTFGSEVQERAVEELIIHPNYNHTTFFNDIAILKLSKPLEINNFVRPCCLWEEDTDLDYVVNREGTVVGWGFDEYKHLSKDLMQAKMPVVSTVTCIYSNREFYSQFTSESNYCAGFRNGTSVCNGDSGGGMVFPKRGTEGKNTVWQLRGIVSVGVALQGEGVCDPTQYIVFTDVAKYLHWIRQILKN